MKRILLVVAGLLLVTGTVTAARAATTATLPPGVHVGGMTYQPSVRLPATRLPHLTPVNGTNASTPVNSTNASQNWSGYVDLACKACALRFIAASFTLPSVDCADSPNGSYVSTWAGLDGVTDTTLEQIGTVASCSGTTATYQAFYEMYPNPPVAFTGVSPGDAISTSVYYNGAAKNWQLGLTDITTGGFIAAIQTCPAAAKCLNANAEVITEAPFSSASNTILPLADFGQANYENIAVTSRSGLHGAMTSTSLWTTIAVDMVDSHGHTLALPGPAYGAQAFQDTWQAAQ
jgi:hypothetical protein